MKKIIISSLLFILFSTSAGAINPYDYNDLPIYEETQIIANNIGFSCGVEPLQPLNCIGGEVVCQCDTHRKCSWMFYGC